MWIARYPWPMKIGYEQGSEFIGHEFKNPLIQCEYRIKAILITSGNPTDNYILEIIYQILGNIIRTYNPLETYIEKYAPCMGILSAAAFDLRSMKYRLKSESSVQLVLL